MFSPFFINVSRAVSITGGMKTTGMETLLVVWSKAPYHYGALILTCVNTQVKSRVNSRHNASSCVYITKCFESHIVVSEDTYDIPDTITNKLITPTYIPLIYYDI
jgi:hypothetical protein